jgi:hypothetical protein
LKYTTSSFFRRRFFCFFVSKIAQKSISGDMMDAVRTEVQPAAPGDADLASTYGLRALATVVFDIDSGQKLDALYPAACGLSEAAKTSLAHLSLPHCNNQDEGDTQFIVRFRDEPDESVAAS